MTSISEPYSVTTLPRIRLSDPLNDCLCSEITDKDNNYVDFGISGSIIGTYILRPTPKLVWSHAISPSTIVTALASFGQFQETKQFAVGLKERRSNKLLFISKSEQTSEDGSSQVVVDTKEITLPVEIKGVKFSQNGKLVYCLLDNGELLSFNFSVDPKISSDPVSMILGNKRTHILFHKFVRQINGSEIINVDGYLVSVESSTAKQLKVKVYGLLNDNELLELSESTIDIKVKSLRLEYDQQGQLLIYNIETQSLSIYSLPNCEIVSEISLANRVKDFHKDSDDVVSISSPAPNRILLTVNGTIFFIETKFQSVLATFSAPKDCKLRILASPQVKGNSLRTKETYFLLLSSDSKQNLTTVQNYSLDVGFGTLRDSLGKGISRIQKKNLTDEEFFQNEITGLSSLIDEKNTGDETFYIENSKSSKQELFEVYKLLKAAKEANDLVKWERIFLPYVKGTSLKEVLAENSKVLNGGKQDFEVFELEKDRVLDSRFYYKVASLIFTKDEEKQITLLSKDFVPEKTLTYLLTHPLFPMEFSNGLLQSLHKFPRLVRQAIVTCPNLSCFELIQQLNVIENEEIFKDTIVRLSEEYSSEKITLETTKIISTNNSKRRKSLQATFDLDKIISKIINLDFGFEILNSFIDSNGLVLSLHYSKTENNLDKLINKIDHKTDSLLINSQLLALVDQSLINSSVNTKGNRKKKSKSKHNSDRQSEQAKQKPLTISENVDDTRVKLDSMLSIDKSSNINHVLLQNKNNNVVDQLNKKVPSYSIDKLIL